MIDIFWFWFFIFLLLVTVFAWPTWPYTRERWVYRRGGGWRYAPSGVAAALALLLLVFFWLGLLAIAWPWYAAPPVAR
jgi:hypothetical protein